MKASAPSRKCRTGALEGTEPVPEPPLSASPSPPSPSPPSPSITPRHAAHAAVEGLCIEISICNHCAADSAAAAVTSTVLSNRRSRSPVLSAFASVLSAFASAIGASAVLASASKGSHACAARWHSILCRTPRLAMLSINLLIFSSPWPARVTAKSTAPCHNAHSPLRSSAAADASACDPTEPKIAHP
eukprot:697172-Pleurochrysis_carterae.AAC.2